jgi:hypothetical protein
VLSASTGLGSELRGVLSTSTGLGSKLRGVWLARGTGKTGELTLSGNLVKKNVVYGDPLARFRLGRLISRTSCHSLHRRVITYPWDIVGLSNLSWDFRLIRHLAGNVVGVISFLKCGP